MVMHIAAFAIAVLAVAAAARFTGTADAAAVMGIPPRSAIAADIIPARTARTVVALEKWGIIRSACGGYTPVVIVGLAIGNTGNALTCENDAGIAVVVEYLRIVCRTFACSVHADFFRAIVAVDNTVAVGCST